MMIISRATQMAYCPTCGEETETTREYMGSIVVNRVVECPEHGQIHVRKN